MDGRVGEKTGFTRNGGLFFLWEKGKELEGVMKGLNLKDMTMVVGAVLIGMLMISSEVFAGDLFSCGSITQSGTYVLQSDVSSNSSCFTVSAPNVILDLNGHKVTYDNAAPLAVPNGSFESVLAGSWDTTNAPNASRSAGTFIKPVTVYDGGNAVRFALPAADQYFESVGTVTLEANTTYSLSAMFRNSGNSETTENAANATRDPLQMSIELAGTAYKATNTGVTWRGFQYTNAVFTTGANPVSGKIRISIANAATAGIKGYAYVDDIRILKANSYGVNLGPNYANAKFFTIKNGTIAQGVGNGYDSHAINMSEAAGEGWSIDHLAITTQGVNSKGISGLYFKNATINNNTFNHNTTTIKSRDNYDGATIHLSYPGVGGATGSSIHHNTFVTGPQTAISIVQSAGYPKQTIYNNTITLQTRYTNDFAISAAGAEVHDNIVNCGSGNNSCRGIVTAGEGSLVYNNTVSVQQLPRSQEYNGCEAFGAYGMQMEYSANNNEVYGNTVTAYAGECEAHAFRANPDILSVSNNRVHDNIFTAIANGTGRASSLKFSELNASALNLYNNTFRTNHRWIYLAGEGAVTNPTFTNNRWETTGTLPSPFQPFEVFTWDNSHFTGTFYGNTYGTGDKARFENEVFRTQGAMTPDLLSSFTIDGQQLIDVVVPLVSISSPVNGNNVSGTVAVNINASDNIGVTKVEFLVNNALQDSDTVAPYSFNWNTTTVINGVYSLTAKAYDAANNVATSSTVTVTVNNPLPDTTAPTVSITNPSNNVSVSGSVLVAASANDAVGVTRVDFYLNGTLRASVNTAPYNFNWDTTAVANASYALTSKAYDAAGNVGTSTGITVLVNNPVADITAPVVSTFTMTATAASLTVAVASFTASDAVGVTGYLITESAAVPVSSASGWTASAPSSYTFSTAGTATAYAWAKDAAGNVSAALPTCVTFSTLQAAYDNAAAGSNGVHLAATAIIPANSGVIPVFIANSGKNITVAGGYDAAYQTRSGVTVVKGTMKIQSGKVIAEGLVLRTP